MMLVGRPRGERVRNETKAEERSAGAMKTRGELFPEVEPRRLGHLDVGWGHRIYWEEAGAADGIPVVFLHGGPGSGASPVHRRFFDPAAYRIIVLDQRGAGRSTPIASTVENTTWTLVADIEVLRVHLGIERWLVFGGSWGSTLALAYGETHPDHCLGFVLRGIFLGEASEIDWFLHGMGRFFPEAHRAYLGYLPEDERDDPLGAYHRRLTDPDPDVHGPAAVAWNRYEAACSKLVPEPEPASVFGEQALALARLEAHYFVHGTFLEPGQLLRDLERIRHLPAVIVQGRYDVICPIATADALARAWPEAEYHVVSEAGHSALEPGIRARLIAATEAMKTRVASSK